MNSIFCLIFLVTYFSVILCQCDDDEPKSRRSITASVSDYPYMVGIIKKSSNKFICAGTIIDDMVAYGIVLTAGSCISKIVHKQDSKQSIIVRSNLKGSTTDYKIIKTHLHPKYDPKAKLNNKFDIGLLAVEGPWKGISKKLLFKFMLPIVPSPPHNILTVTTIGWNQHNNSKLKDLKVDDNLEILPADECNKHNHQIKISTPLFCVTNKLDNKLGATYANVGGPLLYFDKNQTNLIGVITVAPTGNHPAVVANASFHEDFINNILWVLEINKLPTSKEMRSTYKSGGDFCHIKLLYKDVTSDDITFYFYTRSDRKTGTKLKFDSHTSLPPKFSLDKKTFFIIHGWTGSYKTEGSQLVKDAVLNVSDVNVFLVDWEKPAKALGNLIIPYVPSVQLVPKVGQFVGHYINEVMQKHKILPDNVIMMGHSLGAHIAGIAGKILAQNKRKIKYIIGSDPAGPCYFYKNSSDRLDKTDAKFVQTIHTGMETWGIDFPVGTANYFVNGGYHQPKCTDEWAKHLVTFLRSTVLRRSTHVTFPFASQSKNPFWDDAANFLGCSHQRAYKYLAESIISKGCGFTAKQCDSWYEFKKGSCKNNPESHMSSLNIDESARGNYHIETNTQYPYARDVKKTCKVYR
ncbi:hypothetical protein ILUMI_26296 [Ignelater luminosus]|uniref:Peptidase S1 domain-containing protein n=1 Tax=Ignelater luminosus TaxID=2038154 RepID=A0A8K0C6V4_IGNLU|nr:hypothetical protein ILUMI_26296 [Ignelater luminosus]